MSGRMNQQSKKETKEIRNPFTEAKSWMNSPLKTYDWNYLAHTNEVFKDQLWCRQNECHSNESPFSQTKQSTQQGITRVRTKQYLHEHKTGRDG